MRGSVTGAAHRLHLTQPTLSSQLRDLEDELGQRLFIRDAQPIALTPAGALLRRRAEEILALVRQTEADFGVLGRQVAGEVRIGGAETEAMRLIIRTIRALRREHPAIRFSFHSGSAADVTERLDRGLLDFALLIQPAEIARYNALRLPHTDVRGVLMRKDDPLARKKAVTLQDLAGVPLICSRKFLQPKQSLRLPLQIRLTAVRTTWPSIPFRRLYSQEFPRALLSC